jgi:hypothetical protein
MDNREAFKKEKAVAGMAKATQQLVDDTWQACADHYEAERNASWELLLAAESLALLGDNMLPTKDLLAAEEMQYHVEHLRLIALCGRLREQLTGKHDKYVLSMEESERLRKDEISILHSRINNALAVIAQKDKALLSISEYWDGDSNESVLADAVDNAICTANLALALVPSNVKIRLVGAVNLIGQVVVTTDPELKVKMGTQLYTIEKVDE